jgi:hypothetical protein
MVIETLVLGRENSLLEMRGQVLYFDDMSSFFAEFAY